MRSPNRSASSMKCVVRIMMRPSRAFCYPHQSLNHQHMMSGRAHTWRMFQVDRREYGSMPEVGSSRNTTLESPMSAIATESLRFMPPDSARLCTLTFSVKPTSAMILLTAESTYRSTIMGYRERLRVRSECELAFSSGTPFRPAKNRKCSETVKSSQSTSCWGHTPIT